MYGLFVDMNFLLNLAHEIYISTQDLEILRQTCALVILNHGPN